MEFPHIGKHCFQKDCKQLDFLPMKCDACSEIFCNDHIHYNTHSCPDSYKKDNQVPVCPLCNKPIPLKKGELPDTVVGRHIDSDCQSDPAKERRKVYTNKCSMKGCKVKELIPVKCDKCHKNYCLRHRFEDDHDCQGYQGSGKGMSNAGSAALSRLQQPASQSKAPPSNAKPANRPPQQRTLHSLGFGLGSDLDRQRRERQQQGTQNLRAAQAGLSEEEAMARAIQQSLSETQATKPSNTNNTLSQEEEDLLLAQALAASEEEARRRTNSQVHPILIV
ncbi:AN1-type zinc finger protein 2A-like isoform X2 [Ruditapes philippinarum]|uniref:AN1-type zinc finger protein 2A-like isoform X2 n=1 Tax=Ruditapes philippinarum TaxID=129788 RepID=UPI00295AA3C6|nr:AN1-type zinc finger protein 2A-like isoform X2 [Ruditapes philippinarum]